MMFRSIQFILAIFGLVNIVSLANIAGCLPRTTNLATGFNVNFYPYTIGDDVTMYELSYVLTDYKKQTIISTQSGVTDISFYIYIAYSLNVYYAGLYGRTISYTNFTSEYTGYFYADTTGAYTFSLPSVDDSAALFLGDGAAFDCCDTSTASLPTEFLIFTSLAWGSSSTSETVQLEQGTYYPLRIVYMNYAGAAALTFTVKRPDGNILSDFTNVFSFANSDYCPGAAISSPFLAFPTTTGGTTYADVLSKTTTTVTNTEGGYVQVLEVDPYSTVYVTLTSGTILTTTTVSPGSTDSVETIIVDVPIPLTTVTSTWTGDITSTSLCTYVAGETLTVIVEVPTPVETVTSTWSGTRNESYTITASEGGTNTVVIEVPSQKPITTTSTWSGINTTTYTITASNGGPNTVVVEVPTPIVTVTSTWSGTVSTTVTITATEGGTETIIIDVPSHSSTYVSGTSFTSSYTKSSATSSSENNSTFIVSSSLYQTASFSTGESSSPGDSGSSTSASVTQVGFSGTRDSSSTSSISYWGNSSSSSTYSQSSYQIGSFTSNGVNTSGKSITLPSTSGSGGTKTEVDVSTTVITITSCDDGKCTKTPVTTGITVVTITSEDIISEYTTYCPLSATYKLTNEEETKYSSVTTGTNSRYYSSYYDSPYTLPSGNSALSTEAESSDVVSSISADSYQTTVLESSSTSVGSTNYIGAKTSTSVSSSSNPSTSPIVAVSQGKGSEPLKLLLTAIFIAYAVQMIPL